MMRRQEILLQPRQRQRVPPPAPDCSKYKKNSKSNQLFKTSIHIHKSRSGPIHQMKLGLSLTLF